MSPVRSKIFTKSAALLKAKRTSNGMSFKRWGTASMHGDTIVEVLISVAVLATVLGAAYATSTRSLQSGLDAKARGEALSYAQAQLELIKNADNASPSTVGNYKLSRPFCIDPSSGNVTEVNSTTKVCSLPLGETNPAKQLPYSIVDTYNSTSKTFVTKVEWQTQSNQTSQTVLYYKSHNSFVDTPGGSCPLCVSQPVTAPPTVGVSLNANPSYVAYNGTSTLRWTSSNATSCNASGGWSGAKPTSGTQQVGPLTNTATFYLACTNGGSTAQQQVTVTAAAPPTPTLTFTADSYSLPSGGNTNLHWSTSNVPSNRCNASGAWNGSVSSPGSTNTGSLSPGAHTYILTCNGYSGTNSAQGSVTITVNSPPPPPAPTAQMTSISYYWANGNGNLYLYGTVNDHNVSGTTAWFEQSCYGGWNGSDPCNNLGAFPTSSQNISTNSSNNSISQHIYPWTFYYYGYHDPYYFRICARNTGGTSCSATYSLYQ